jgi:hypothetical protein
MGKLEECGGEEYSRKSFHDAHWIPQYHIDTESMDDRH